MARAILSKFNLAAGGIKDADWIELLSSDENGMPRILKWIHDWCQGNDKLNHVEEFLCTLIVDEVIKTDRMVDVGSDAVAQLIHLRIHCGSMITRRFDHLNNEVRYLFFVISLVFDQHIAYIILIKISFFSHIRCDVFNHISQLMSIKFNQHTVLMY